MSIADALHRRMVWEKGQPIGGYSPDIWRFDAFGNLIHWPHYGDRSSKYGWEIDHIVPKAAGGMDHLSNLRPLRCRDNASLGGLLGGMLR